MQVNSQIELIDIQTVKDVISLKEIKIAIVGFGKIAKTHAMSIYCANLRMDLPFRLKLSHIVTSRPEDIKLDDVKLCTSLEEALDEVDVVDICNINQAHLESIKKAAESNKAIYCEKPVGSTIEEAKDACDIAKENDVLNGVAFMYRYLPSVHLLKNALDEKRLGEIIAFEMKYYHNGYLSDAKRQSWKTSKEAGGGALLDLGIHMIDLVKFIFGEVEKATHQKSIHFSDVSVDEYSYTRFKIKTGVEGTLVCSRVFTSKIHQPELKVYCEKGSLNIYFSDPYDLEIIYQDGSSAVLRADKNEEFMKYCANGTSGLDFHTEAHMVCLCDFMRKVYDGKSSGFGSDFRDSYKAQILI